jgi:2-(1,2-epoxy-1,2-dihydrophenyl)acetyl-CoA isomerase
MTSSRAIPLGPPLGGEIAVETSPEGVATVEIRRPPANHLDVVLVERLVEVLEGLATSRECRAVLLCSRGRHFCAGADLVGGAMERPGSLESLYAAAARLFEAPLPIVAAVQGGAVGGGLGLALVADLRVATPSSFFQANFARIGLHHGFGLSETLPTAVGRQRATDLLLSARRVGGEEALAMGLCDRLASETSLRADAHALATSLAAMAPLALASIRATLREGLAERVREATDREAAAQLRCLATADFAEGIRAVAERREPQFEGR